MLRPIFNNVHDTTMRLNNTIIFYKGEPVRVFKVKESNIEDILLCLHYLFDEGFFEVNVQDPALDIKAPSLGYINVNESAYFLRRYPQRRMKQGLPCDGVFTGRRRNSFDIMSHPKEATKMLRGEYPSFKEALSMIKEGRFQVAFDSEASIDAGNNIFFRGRKVGVLQKEGGLKMALGYESLEGYLREIMNAS